MTTPTTTTTDTVVVEIPGSLEGDRLTGTYVTLSDETRTAMRLDELRGLSETWEQLRNDYEELPGLDTEHARPALARIAEALDTMLATVRALHTLAPAGETAEPTD